MPVQRLHVHSPSPSDKSAVCPELPAAAVLHGHTYSMPCILCRKAVPLQKLLNGSHLDVLCVSLHARRAREALKANAIACMQEKGCTACDDCN